MPRQAQAADNASTRVSHVKRLTRALVAAGFVAILSGCGGGGLSLGDDESSVVTASTPAPVEKTGMMSDQSIIRNAVSAADIDSFGNTGLAWANTDTGSRGSIASISEYTDSGATCRRFTVSRESFDGVGVYDGDACLAGGGAWKLRAFKSM